MIKIDGQEFEYVKFPDGTCDTSAKGWNINIVEWFYTGEIGELFVILSLLEFNNVSHVKFHFLPYARQDKKEGFGGLYAFLKIFRPYEHMTHFHVFDAHNRSALPVTWHHYDAGYWFEFDMNKSRMVIFPDENAYDKYGQIYGESDMTYVIKERDPITGKIKSIALVDEINDAQDIYVIDDICDGGATFIELAKILPKDRHLHLFTTYGIYSKGKECLYEAGYTTVECRHSIFGR